MSKRCRNFQIYQTGNEYIEVCSICGHYDIICIDSSSGSDTEEEGDTKMIDSSLREILLKLNITKNLYNVIQGQINRYLGGLNRRYVIVYCIHKTMRKNNIYIPLSKICFAVNTNLKGYTKFIKKHKFYRIIPNLEMECFVNYIFKYLELNFKAFKKATQISQYFQRHFSNIHPISIAASVICIIFKDMSLSKDIATITDLSRQTIKKTLRRIYAFSRNRRSELSNPG